MAIAFRSSNSNAGVAGATSVAVTTPTGVVAGDLLIAVLGSKSNTTAQLWNSVPSGWTLSAPTTINNAVAAIAYKIATASEPASYTFGTSAANGQLLAAVAAYSGVNNVAPFLSGVPLLFLNTNTTVAGGSVAPVRKSGTVTVAFGAATSTLATLTLNGYTVRENLHNTGNTANVLLADQAQANNSTTPSIVNSVAASSMMGTLVLNPDQNVANSGGANGILAEANPGTSLQFNQASSAVAPGVLAVVSLTFASAPTALTAPSGWTLLGSRTGVTPQSYVYYKLMTAADYANPGWIWTWSNSLSAGGVFYVFGSTAQTSPVNSFTAVDYSATTAWGWPQIAAPTGSGLIVLLSQRQALTTDTTIDAAVTKVYGPVGSLQGHSVYTAPFSIPAGAYTHTVPSTTGSDMLFAVGQAQSPPLAPTLTAPANASYQDLAAGFTFTETYNPAVVGNTQTNYAFRRKISGAGAYEYWNASTGAFQSTIVWNASASGSLTFGSGKWTDGNIYNWSFATQDAGGQGPFASDLTVTASAAPTSLVVVTPSGTTTSSSPTVSWTDTLQAGASQTNYRIVVESGAYGTTPGSGTTAWDSGTVASSATSVPTGVVLSNGVTYRWFVMVTETGGQTSSWATSDATVAYSSPAAPLVTVVWDPSLSRCVLTVQGRDNLLSANDSSFETTVGTWVAQTNCAVARSTAQFMDGSASLALTSSAAGAMVARTAQGVSGYVVQPNKQYTTRASFRAAVSPRTGTVTVNWWQASGAASAVRASDTSVGVVDATGAWSANASVTAVSPADAAFASVSVSVAATGGAGEVHYVDEASISPGAAAPWASGGFAGAGAYTVQASEDGGTTWVSVRGMPVAVDSASDQVAVVYDYERTPSTLVSYRAQVSNGSGSSLVTSPYGPTVTVTTSGLTSWWVKDIQVPANNLALCDAQENVRTNKGDAVAIYPVGRLKALVLKGPVHSAASKLRTVVKTEADRALALSLFGTQDDILVQDPRGRQWYAEWVGDLVETQLRVDQPYYALERSWVEVDVPS